MSVPRLIVVGCLAALASGLFGYFVLFEPDESPSSAVPTSIDAPVPSSVSPPTTTSPSTTVAPPPPDPVTTTSSSTTTTTAKPEPGEGRGPGKRNNKPDDDRD
jgi:hypothetical protein